MKKELITLAFLFVLIAGCNSQTTPPSDSNNNSMQSQGVKHQSTDKNDEEKALYLENLAKGIDGVKDAHVVVVGKTAIVGIDVDSKLERSRVGTIKYSVSEAFSKDPYGVQAIVTADLDLNERIAEIGNDIRAGRPVRGMIEELSDIVGRIVPQVPVDLMPTVNEQQLNEGKNIKDDNSKNSKQNINTNNQLHSKSKHDIGKYNTPEQIIEEQQKKMKNN